MSTTSERPVRDAGSARDLRHDLRTPLHAVLGFAELLALTPLDDAAADHLRHLREAADRLRAIVDSIA